MHQYLTQRARSPITNLKIPDHDRTWAQENMLFICEPFPAKSGAVKSYVHSERSSQATKCEQLAEPNRMIDRSIFS